MKCHQFGTVLFLLPASAQAGLEPLGHPLLIPPWLPDMSFIYSFLMGLFPLPRYSVETLSTVAVERWNEVQEKSELFSLLKCGSLENTSGISLTGCQH